MLCRGGVTGNTPCRYPAETAGSIPVHGPNAAVADPPEVADPPQVAPPQVAPEAFDAPEQEPPMDICHLLVGMSSSSLCGVPYAWGVRVDQQDDHAGRCGYCHRKRCAKCVLFALERA